MNMYLHLAICYLKKQKTRSLILIIGVALAIMLVFGFNVINESQSKNQLNTIYELYGSYHSSFSNLDKTEVKELKKDKDITEIDVVADLGEGIYKNGITVKLNSSNDQYINEYNYKLKKGRLPERPNEIVLEEKALEQMGLEKKLNQAIDLKVKKEYQDQNGIHQIFVKNHQFKIVGILEKPERYYEDFYYFMAFTFFEEGSNNILSKDLITYTGVVDLKSDVNNISNNLNTIKNRHNIGKLDFQPNTRLITALSDFHAAQNNNSKNDTKLLVIITAIFLIYNLFNISLTEMIKQVGTLRTIGASKKQIRIIFMIQSVIILVLGMIGGLLGGLLFSYFGMQIFTFTGTGIDTSITRVHISSKSLLDAIKVGSITVLISSIIPIYIAGRISPLNALRKADKSKTKQKIRLHHKVIRKFFGISGEMAYKNVWRNKIRTIVSILAISIGGILFIDTVATARGDWLESTNINVLNMQDSSFKLSYGVNIDNHFTGYTEKDIQEISNINGIESIKVKTELEGFLELNSNHLQEEYKKYNGILDKNQKTEIPGIIKSYGDKQLKTFEKYAYKGELSPLNKETGQYANVAVLNNYYDSLEDHRPEEVIKGLEVGDIINIKIPIIKNNILKYEYYEVRVGTILDPSWIFSGDSVRGSYPEVIISQDNLAEMIGKNSYSEISLTTEEGKDGYVNEELVKILEKKPGAVMESKLEYQKEDDDAVKENIMSKMTIISLILLIATLNIFYSIRTNFLLRINEFSTLRAIGMTVKQIKSMLLKEAIIYGILSSTIAALTGSYKYYKFMQRVNADYAYGFNMSSNVGTFHIPILEILIFTCTATIVCILAAYLSNKKIEKLNIIEGLKAIE